MTSQGEHFQVESNAQMDGTVVITVHGEVDLASAPSLRTLLSEIAERKPAAIVLDLADLEFIDSSGISTLVEAQLRASREGRQLTLRNVPDSAIRIFNLAGLTSQFTILSPGRAHQPQLRTEPSFG